MKPMSTSLYLPRRRERGGEDSFDSRAWCSWSPKSSHGITAENSDKSLNCFRRRAVRAMGYKLFTGVQDCADQHGLVLKMQLGESLGERMKNAMGSMFVNGADLAFIVGSDCPELNSDYLRMMIHKSSEQDLLLAPAEDGGYCLIGSRSLHSELFSGIEWGEAQVLEQTLSRPVL